MEQWQIDYSQEVKNYFWDNRGLIGDLYAAIRKTTYNNGFPDGPYVEGPRIEIYFEAHHHTVVYERWLTQQMIRITQIIPGPDA